MLSTLFPTLAVRVVLSAVTSFVLALIIGPRVIDALKGRQIGQTIREEGVQEHRKKAGIPTMGGVIFLVPAVLATLLFAGLNLYVSLGLVLCLGMAGLGMMDDLTKVIKARSLGLTPRQKLVGQIVCGLVAAVGLRYFPAVPSELPLPAGQGGGTLLLANSFIQVPRWGFLDLGMLYLPFVTFVVVAFTNAVNLNDGLDGLAAGSVAISLLPFTIVAFVTGQAVLARAAGVAYTPGTGELAAMAAALFGGCLGFLWYNAHPAQVFMGDTGSMGLGGAVAALAVCTRTELLAVVIGGLFVVEALSVVLQVSYFKWTKGQRIFRMSPIHHHFELCGWAEEKVVTRFWIVGAALALAGLSLFASRLLAS